MWVSIFMIIDFYCTYYTCYVFIVTLVRKSVDQYNEIKDGY